MKTMAAKIQFVAALLEIYPNLFSKEDLSAMMTWDDDEMPDDDLDYDDVEALMNLPTGCSSGYLGADWYPYGFDVPRKKKRKSCTCGAEATYGEDTPHHSDWCDRHE